MPLHDAHGRPLRNLRISVTDRCNLRCAYCMPEDEYAWLPRSDVLSFEEVSRLVDVFCELGVEKVRLTGGEPLLRRELPTLVRELARKPAIRDLAMTTNAVMLDGCVEQLRDAGLARLTVSLDTLRRSRFTELTRRDELQRTLAGIDAACAIGIPLKINVVLMRGRNDDEIADLIEFAKGVGAEIRFIEYMDVGGATQWEMNRVVPRAEILRRVGESHGAVRELPRAPSAPAERFALEDGTTFGVVASTTAPFCGSCDRGRLTADGRWFLCLYAADGLELREPLRAGATDSELADLIRSSWQARDDRGAERRLATHDREPLLAREVLRHDPHAEMHTRGG